MNKLIGILATFSLLAFSPLAGAAYEVWTRKDGKAAEMELLKLEQKDGEEMVSFRTRAGGTVTMKLVDLQQAEWKRARDAAALLTGPQAALVSFERASANRAEVKKGEKEFARMEWLFTVRGGTYAGFKKGSLKVEPFQIGGKTIPTKAWNFVSDKGPKDELRVTAAAVFEPAALSGCKLSASVVALTGATKQTARVEAKIPAKIGATELDVGPLKVELTHGERKTNNGGERYLLLNARPEDFFRVLKCHFDVDGEETRQLYPGKDQKEVTVVVEYWEELVESTLKLEATAP